MFYCQDCEVSDKRNLLWKEAQQKLNVHKIRIKIEEKQVDSRANKTVTDDVTILQNYQSISSIPIYGVGKDKVACTIVGKGYLNS